MMAGSRTFTVLPRLVFVMLLMRCDGNAPGLPIHLRGEEATVTKIRCNAPVKTNCVNVNVTECPVTAHVCLDGKLHITSATRDGCLIASRGGINEKELPFIEVIVDSANMSLIKLTECTYLKNLENDTTFAQVKMSHINATKMTFCAGDALCNGHQNVTYDHGVCHGDGSIRDIAFRLVLDNQKNALTPEISNSTSSFEMFNSSSLVFYKSNFTMGHKGAMIEAYILQPLGSDYQLHIDTDTDVCFKTFTFPRRSSATPEGQSAPPDGHSTPPEGPFEPTEGHYVALKATVSVLAVICVVVLILVLVFVFRKMWTSRSLYFTSNLPEAEVPLQ